MKRIVFLDTVYQVVVFFSVVHSEHDTFWGLVALFNQNKSPMTIISLLSVLFRSQNATCIQEEVLFQENPQSYPFKRAHQLYAELLRIMKKQDEGSLNFSEQLFLTKHYASYKNELNGLSLSGQLQEQPKPSK